MTIDDVRAALAPLDPAPDRSPATYAERTADLHLIMADRIMADRTAAARRSWRPAWGLGFAGIATAAVAGVVALTVLAPGPRPSYVATPKPLTYTRPADAKPASELLTALANRVAALPGDAPANTHLLIRHWDLFTSLGDRTTSSVEESRTEVWRAPDNSGVTVKVSASGHRESERFKPGTFPAMWPDRAPADQARLARWLTIGHPVSNGPGETIAAITDLLRERVLWPRERAALLRVLATVPGITYDGSVTDRAGRRGESFSVESRMTGLPTRYGLIVDPATGVLLANEQMLTRTAGKLNVPVPSVIGYELYLKADG